MLWLNPIFAGGGCHDPLKVLELLIPCCLEIPGQDRFDLFRLFKETCFIGMDNYGQPRHATAKNIEVDVVKMECPDVVPEAGM